MELQKFELPTLTCAENLAVTSGEIPLDTMIVRKQPAFAEMIDDELVIFYQEHGSYFGLNKAGQEVWDKTEQSISFQELVDYFATRYSLDSKHITTLLFNFFYTSVVPSPFMFEPTLSVTSNHSDSHYASNLYQEFLFVPTMQVVLHNMIDGSGKPVVDPTEGIVTGPS